MSADRLELRPLMQEDEESFRRAVVAFARDTPPWGFAVCFDPAAPFSEYVSMLQAWPKGERLVGNFVPNTFLVGVVDGRIVGRLSLRHRLNASLERVGGHIGYGVVPSERRRGYATAMLRQSLPLCVRLGLERVLVTCDEDNVGSRRAIERCGGIYQDSVEGPDLNTPKRRYWIDTSAFQAGG